MREPEELLDCLREARESSRRRSLFLAELSQQLQAPLNGLLGMTHLLGDTDLDDRQAQILEAIDQTCGELVRALGDLSRFSSLEAGEISVEREPFALHAALKGVVGNAVFDAHRKHLTLSCRIDDDVPHTVLGDRAKIRHVLTQLLENAIRHTDAGEITIQVGSDQRTDDGWTITVAVSDTGSGVSCARARRLFRFPDHDSLDEERVWSGLGLAICRDLAELMGGRVGFESEEGVGSTFWFSVGVGEIAPQTEVEPRPPTPDSARPARPILLVTADPDAATHALVALNGRGFAVELERDPTRIGDALRSARYGLILLDGEKRGHLATFAAWSQIGEVSQVPVLGLPRRSGGRRDVDIARLLDLVARWQPATMPPA